jgi:hypothetical protein
MKKIFKCLLSFLFISIIFLTSYVKPAKAQSGLFFGQDHKYSVIFRGNGEAVVYARIALTNGDEDILRDISFEIPGVDPSEMVIYQIELPRECIEYDYTGGRRCLEYTDPDYFQNTYRYPGYYYGGSSGEIEYSKLDFSRTGNLYEVELADPVSSYDSTAVVVAYTAKGYVKNTLGLYRYEFETFKVPSRIQDLSVAIDVDSDLYLKGKKAEVNYSSDIGSDLLMEASPSAGITSKQLDNVVGSIGYGGKIVKNAENLSPNESFTVNGQYSKSWLRLYLSTIIVVILIIAGVFAAAYFLPKYLKKKGIVGKTDKSKDKEVKSTNKDDSKKEGEKFFSILHIGVGLLTVILTVGLTFLIYFLSNTDLLYNLMYSGPWMIGSILSLLTAVLLYFIAIFGPAIFVAIKKGWKSFLSIIIMAVLWAIFFMIVGSIFLQAVEIPVVGIY